MTLGSRLAFAGRAREMSGFLNRPYAPSGRIERNPLSTRNASAVSQSGAIHAAQALHLLGL